MAPKKKPPPKKGAEGEVDLFEEFLKKYNKNKKEFDTIKINDAEAIIQQIQDEGEDIPAWDFSQAFDQMSFRILMHSLRHSGYLNIKGMRIWKCNGGDESVRSVCYYLDSNPPPEIEDLQFTDNAVSPLGCEFLGRTLGPTGNKKVSFLRLDYNQFGAPGVEKLSLGLAQNATLRTLSLQYCGIGPEGGQYLAHILMFIKSALEDVRLRGNNLGRAGVVDVFIGARRAKCLRSLDLFDCKFSETPDVIEGLLALFQHNTKLEKYNLAGNDITDVGAQKLIHGMIGQSHLKEISVPERCNLKTFEALEAALGAGKGKKGKKGKKK
eukprot:gnl/MRDRNA2_/MRDRNA2_100149_c0_seq1.p1 gnl/MRDRNA2_/MRDRNA2_100149_c0~~gnl/MRDRNA2_/MRDRNA2_100149_c0_seq1.p1  ORF type:complete len:355 (+),score=66.54 gnl/MRDRNA2_/MRDRNA2_100149_c0_seq1:95-1066(+)